MEWIRRNPKTAIALSALAVLCVVVLAFSLGKGSPSSAEDPILGGPGLTDPTPGQPLTGLPSPSATPTGQAGLSQLDALMAQGAAGGAAGTSHSLERHDVELIAGADQGLAAIGWRMPHAVGATGGVAKAPGKYWKLDKVNLGMPPWIGLYTYVGEWRGKLWCTVKVDGKVVSHEEAHGPWGSVYCAA